MAEVVLFHHAQGRTPGVVVFADEIRQAGHTVHVPDLYDGRTFDDLEAGVAHARQVGFDTLADRGAEAAEGLRPDLVYAGLSLGVVPAQRLAQTRRGAAGALLISACIPPQELGTPWPPGVPVQIHGMDSDAWFVDDGDLDAARELVGSVEDAELYLYDGDQHLFADSSLPSYDHAATGLLLERVLRFLGAVPTRVDR